MKAYVYAVQTAGRWTARMSISPSVDAAYWLNEHSSQIIGSDNRLEPLARTMLRSKEELPLSVAVRAVSVWEELTRSVVSTLQVGKAAELLIQSIRLAELQRDKRSRPLPAQVICINQQAGHRLPPALVAAAQAVAAATRGRALLRGEVAIMLSTNALLSIASPIAREAMSAKSEQEWLDALQLAAIVGLLRLSIGVTVKDGRPSCQRCGSSGQLIQRTECASCGRVCSYCEACLTMGRSRECELLVLGAHDTRVEGNNQLGGHAGRFVERIGQRQPGQRQPLTAGLASKAERLAIWKLSPAQTEAAGLALQFIERHAAHKEHRVNPNENENGQIRFPSYYLPAPHRTLSLWQRWQSRDKTQESESSPSFSPSFLLWAVTGAGKTEMVFPLIESVLKQGGKALLATPRRDVVLELDPRMRKAFPNEQIVTLYGGSEQRWDNGTITLATTHQLFRFYQAFDLVIIDELDAFPYHGDPQLHYAAAKSCHPAGSTILLSATPPVRLQRAARKGKLPHARVPVRYHRHPLPVPQVMRIPSVQMMLQKAFLPNRLKEALLRSVQRDAQLFVFVQQIRQIQPMVSLLRRVLPGLSIEGTYSSDAERTERVQRFRRRELRILVTTTILERGVTIPRSDIFILDADGRLFDEASLVQMAGRAGRSGDDPHGLVYFCSSERSRSQNAAIRQIRTMNRIAARKGYLRDRS